MRGRSADGIPPWRPGIAIGTVGSCRPSRSVPAFPCRRSNGTGASGRTRLRNRDRVGRRSRLVSSRRRLWTRLRRPRAPLPDGVQAHHRLAPRRSVRPRPRSDPACLGTVPPACPQHWSRGVWQVLSRSKQALDVVDGCSMDGSFRGAVSRPIRAQCDAVGRAIHTISGGLSHIIVARVACVVVAQP